MRHDVDVLRLGRQDKRVDSDERFLKQLTLGWLLRAHRPNSRLPQNGMNGQARGYSHPVRMVAVQPRQNAAREGVAIPSAAHRGAGQFVAPASALPG